MRKVKLRGRNQQVAVCCLDAAELGQLLAS
jgi:hypothetical protein